MQHIHSILGGDLNLYMNQRLDKVDNSPDYNDNRNFRADVCSFVETNNIIDVWRTINPDKDASRDTVVIKDPGWIIH